MSVWAYECEVTTVSWLPVYMGVFSDISVGSRMGFCRNGFK